MKKYAVSCCISLCSLMSLNINAATWSAPSEHYWPAIDILEVQGTTPDNYVVTGLGFRAKKSEITTMLLRGSSITEQGLQGTSDRRFGKEPNHALEVFAQCPSGNVVTSVSMRVKSGNVVNLGLKCVKYNEDDFTLDYSTHHSVDVALSGYTPEIYEMTFSLDNHTSYDFDKTFMTGFGVREYGDNVKNMWGELKLLLD